jgi:hypothetical protein
MVQALQLSSAMGQTSVWRFTFMILSVFGSLSAQAQALSDADARDQVLRLYQRLAGVPPTASSLASLIPSMKAGDPTPTALAAMNEDSFYKTTLIRTFSPFSNTQGNIDEVLNDYNATVVGLVRNNHDFREALYGDVLYTAENALSIYSVTVLPPLGNANDTVDRCPLNIRTRNRPALPNDNNPATTNDRDPTDLTWRRISPDDLNIGDVGSPNQRFQPHLDGYQIEPMTGGMRPALPEYPLATDLNNNGTPVRDEAGAERVIPPLSAAPRTTTNFPTGLFPLFRDRAVGNNDETNPVLSWSVCHDWTGRSNVTPPAGFVRPLVAKPGERFRYALEDGVITHYSDLQKIPNWPSRLQLRKQTDVFEKLENSQNGKLGTADSEWSEDIAGLFTTLTGGRAYFEAGTNRRGIALTFMNWLGYSMEQLHDPNVPGQYVRQDLVPNDTCAGCHNKMDAMANSMNRLDYVDGQSGRLTYNFGLNNSNNSVNQKLFRGCVNPANTSCVRPNGFDPRTLTEATRNQWWNLATSGRNSFLGWRNPGNGVITTQGTGLNSLMKVFANTQAFSERMAKIAHKAICLRDPTPAETEALSKISEDFESGFSSFAEANADSPYNMRGLFAEVSKNCFGRKGGAQ